MAYKDLEKRRLTQQRRRQSLQKPCPICGQPMDFRSQHCKRRLKHPISERARRKLNLLYKSRSGHPQSKETRQKMRLNNLGKKLKEETKRKISLANIGKNNPRWKGGTTPIAERIRGSDRYKYWRTQIFLRDNFTCQKCGNRKSGNLEAHHFRPFKILLMEVQKYMPLFDPREAALIYSPMWDLDNGITLCKQCHLKTKGHHK